MDSQGPVRNQLEQKALDKKWTESKEGIIKGKKGHYKIDRERFLGRGGFGIVYVAYRKYTQDTLGQAFYEEVVMKQFKKSQKWRSKQDWDRQLLIFEKLKEYMSSKYVLKIIDIFQSEVDKKYYMISRYASEGTLADRVKKIMPEKQIKQFAIRSAQILHYLHYEMLRNCKPQQQGGQQNQPLGVIHGDFKPSNLVFTKDKKMFLIDFGIARVGYTQLVKPYSNSGTNSYKAPEVRSTKEYNCKVDVYSFGCSLYEVLSGGQRLLGGGAYKYQDVQRQKLVYDKLIYLEDRLLRLRDSRDTNKRIGNPLKWIELLTKCLESDLRSRWNSKQLLEYLQNFDNDDGTDKNKKYFFANVSEKDRQLRYKKECYELNFQIHRVNLCQDIVFSIFQFYYMKSPRLSKLTLYVVLKYATVFILEKFYKAKEKAKIYERKDKLELLKRLIDQKKLEEIKKKANQKIKRQVDRQIQKKGRNTGKGPIEEMILKHPQLIKQQGAESIRPFLQYCYQNKKELMDINQFGKMVACLIHMVEDLSAYKNLKVQLQQFRTKPMETLSIKKLFYFRKEQEQRVQTEGLEDIFNSCQVQHSGKSPVNNVEDGRGDIPFVSK